LLPAGRAGSTHFDDDLDESWTEDAGTVDDIRSTAALALGMVGGAGANQLLIAALTAENSPRLRRNAAWALGSIEDARATHFMRKEVTTTFPPAVRQPQLEKVFPPLDASVVDALVDALDDPEPDVRSAIVWALGKCKDSRTTETLIGCLADHHAGVRASAARALRMLEDKRSSEPLVRALADPSELVRLYAAMTLSCVGDLNALGALKLAAHDTSAMVRRASLEALVELDTSTCVEEATAALDDADPDVRLMAEFALGRSGDARAAPLLAEIAKGSDEELRRRAVEALTFVSAATATDLLKSLVDDRNPEICEIAARSLSERVPGTIDRWLDDLQRSDKSRRLTAIAVLSHTKDVRAVDPILGLLQHPEAEVRERAVTALSWIGDPRAIDGVHDLLQDLDPDVRDAAVLALGRLGDTRVIDELAVSILRHLEGMKDAFRDSPEE
jgi:HEAT repeat protein